MLKKIKPFKAPYKSNKEIVINIEPLETRVAVLENKNLALILIEENKL